MRFADDNSPGLEVRQLPLERLLEAEWNANRVPARLLAKVRRSIEEYGVVENLVARPHPSEAEKFELLSGNHRLRILRELGYAEGDIATLRRERAV